MKKPDQDFFKNKQNIQTNKKPKQITVLIHLLSLETERRPLYSSFWDSDVL